MSVLKVGSAVAVNESSIQNTKEPLLDLDNGLQARPSSSSAIRRRLHNELKKTDTTFLLSRAHKVPHQSGGMGGVCFVIPGWFFFEPTAPAAGSLR